MEREYNFEKGQRVKMRDQDDGTMAYGEVVDTTSISVFIKWEDLTDACEHFKDEFNLINLR